MKLTINYNTALCFIIAYSMCLLFLGMTAMEYKCQPRIDKLDQQLKSKDQQIDGLTKQLDRTQKQLAVKTARITELTNNGG